MTIKFSSATAENCTTGCELSFDYKETTLAGANMGTGFMIGFDPIPTTPPVVYNTVKYTSRYGFIGYTTSNHIFTINGSIPAATLSLVHQSDKNMLIMMIPIVESSDNQTAASKILTDTLNDALKKAPTTGKFTFPNFSFQSIFPSNSPFFYTKQGTYESIVFENAISINKTVLDNFKKVTKPSPNRDTGANQYKIYYNPNGANSIDSSSDMANDDEIYIDCQPVNSSKETVQYVEKNPVKLDLSTIVNDPTTYLVLQLVLSCLVFVIIYALLNMGFKYMTMAKPMATAR